MPDIPGRAPALGYNQYPGQTEQGNRVYPPDAYFDWLTAAEDREAEYARLGVIDAEAVRQADREYGRLLAVAAQQYDVAMAQIAADRGNTSVDAQSRIAAAQASANAAIEAAQIAAEASKYDADTRLQIAREQVALGREQLGVEKSRIFWEEFGRPSQWTSQTGFARGWEPAQAEALKLPVPGWGGEGAGAPALTGVGAPTAPQAIVGEPGPMGEAQPELATALPTGGALITPLKRPYTLPTNRTGSWAAPIPRMGFGGVISNATRTARGVVGRDTVSYPWQAPTIAEPGGVIPADAARALAIYRAQQTSTPTPPVSTMPAGQVNVQPRTTGIRPGAGGFNPATGGYTSGYVSPPGSRSMVGAGMTRATRGLSAEELAGAQRPTAWGPGAVGLQNPYWQRQMQQYGQQQGAGQGGGPAAPTVPTAPPTPATTPLDELFRQMQQPNQAAFGAWTGPTTLPQIGLNQSVKPPWQYNLQEWQALPYPQKAMLAGTWRALTMIAGETEAEMLANAEESMRRSAWTGAGPAMPSYGSW